MRTSRLPVALAAVVAALGATLAGCSGGGGSASSGGPLTRAQLITEANAICAAEVSAGERIPHPDDIQDPTQAAEWLDQVDPLISSTTNKLAALQPDGSAASDWSTFIRLRKAFTNKMHEIRAKADAKDRSGLKDLLRLSTTALAAAAEKVGAKTCDEYGQ
jgi:hypothetical protein